MLQSGAQARTFGRLAMVAVTGVGGLVRADIVPQLTSTTRRAGRLDGQVNVVQNPGIPSFEVC